MSTHAVSFRGYFMYLIAVIFLCFEMALQVSPSVMTHFLMADFSIGANVLGVMASFYFYSYTLMQIPAGILFDRMGPKMVLTVAILICSLGALFFSKTLSVEFASLGRFLMGIGSAFAFIGVLIVAARFFPAPYFAFLVGIAQLLAALGALGGELPLAYWINQEGWRIVIAQLSVFGFILAIITLFVMKDHPGRKAQQEAHPPFLKSLKEIFSHKQTWWIALYAFCGWAPMAVFAALWGVPYIMRKYDVANTHAAAAVAMIWLGIGLTSPLIGHLSDLIQRRLGITTTCSLIGLISSSVVLYFPLLPFWMTFPFLFFFGIACAGQILSFALVRDINRPTVTGTAIGLNNMAVVLGGALFQPLVGWLLTLFWDGEIRQGIPIYHLATYELALSVVPICFAIGLITSIFFIEETHCKSRYS